MRYLICIFSIVFLLSNLTCSASGMSLSGGVQKEDFLKNKHKYNMVIDSITGKPVQGAKVSLPAKGFTTYSDKNGVFDFNVDVENPTIMSVEAGGYKPYSITVNKGATKPYHLGIEKKTTEIVIDTTLHHLGDNQFSQNSANAGEFKQNSTGYLFKKSFYVKPIQANSQAFLRLGSIIGVDTALARRLGQNNIITSVSSATKIYINKKRIAEIKINGDNQLIKIPHELLHQNGYNEVAIVTGKNLFQQLYIDYDDIEFMNLTLEFR